MTYYVLVFVDKSNSAWDRVGSLYVRVCVFCVAAKEKKRKEKKKEKKNEEERVTMNSERLTQAVIKL